MARNRRAKAGFSLVEVLIVIALMGILAGVVLPSSNPTIHDQLRSAAQILGGDLAYARSLAVTHGSTYRVTFDLTANRYVLRHSGTNPALDRLPASPFRNLDDPADEHIVELGDLPHVGAPVQLEAVAIANGALTKTDKLEFGPLGETTESGYTQIWLSAGADDAKRFIVIYINPITGLATIGSFTANGPSFAKPPPPVAAF